jgi:hypothetical protein
MMSGEELLNASERGDLAEINRLLSEGVDANHKDNVCDCDELSINFNIYYIT